MLRHLTSPRYETSEARQWVAQQLGLPYHDRMQDWPWEVATPDGLDDYFALYAQAAEDSRVVLMEMLLEAASVQPSPKQLRAAWLRIQVLLDQHADLHAATARYWCQWFYSEQQLTEHGFKISPYVRSWCRGRYLVPMPTN